ncbi:hypothetical protein GBAR_LOCUS11736 [Geodia barretti]|uniref:Uncharacterized protein n=1 Tax=Geodia barretti TaxID=519541 RepID=A0AA35RXJ2_GEOBA|nr:hypothetical protein GBAR_LOCUS11736 [Geodia barretti]
MIMPATFRLDPEMTAEKLSVPHRVPVVVVTPIREPRLVAVSEFSAFLYCVV